MPSAPKRAPKAVPVAEFPEWINELVGGAATRVFNEAKSALISKAQSALVEPLAERVGRAMAKAEDAKYDDVWKMRAFAALAELSKRPGGSANGSGR